MGDQELEAIRQSRLQQLKQQGGGGSGGKDPEAASANDEAKHMDLARILEPQAWVDVWVYNLAKEARK